jgi:hypothetical protein
MSPFDLIIEFVGLCMFVPERDAAGAATVVHVLLVAPEHHVAHCPRVFYDTGHDAAAGGPTGVRTSIALDDKLLDLTGVTGNPGTLTFALPHVPNLTKVTGFAVPGTADDDKPGELIGARVMLGSGRTDELLQDGFAFPGISDMKIAIEVHWTIPQVSTGSGMLEWALKGLNELGGQPLCPLRPVIYSGSSAPQVRLRIKNVPRTELSLKPPTGNETPPPFGAKAAHFEGHYEVLGAVPNLISPIYIGPPPSGGGSGTAFSCMPSAGEFVPPHS